MIADIKKFGLLWTTRDAKTNTLYTVKDDSFYNSCKLWFMLVQDRNNNTQYLAFHNTSKIKDQIITHIRTSTYSHKQKLYEVDNISLNKNPNIPKHSKTDYDTIFDDKNLYAIPEQYIDIIGNIDPNMVKYIEKFKKGNKLKQQGCYLLSITADTVESTDERFTMDNLSLGNNFKPIDVYFQTADGNTVSRNRIKGEKKISNQTLPRIAFQIFEKQISNMSLMDKKNFPICRYSLNSDAICGIYSSVEEFRKHRKTLEYMQYKCDNNKKFVIYCWNIFSTIIFVQECLKRFGNQGEKFVLSYTKKDKNEMELENSKLLKQRDYIMEKTVKNLILYGPPGTGKTYNTVIKAMEIINPSCIRRDENEDVKNYSEVKKEFDNYKNDDRIEFITFHQSYSYEEFVEGIKPDLDTEFWNEPVDKLTYKGTNGVFKAIANRALFDRLNIKTGQQDAILDFKNLKELFIEEYSVGAIFKTGTKNAEFRIDKYTKDSARITPINGKYTYSITFKYLEEAYNKKMSSQSEIATINGVASGLSCYYYAIYEKLLDIKKSNDNNQVKFNISEISDEDKLQLVKDYYEGKIEINNDKKGKPYVLIIDEINRGNISKIFGELITLIEEDKRENLSVKLPYSQETFTVPKNLYIIGTMNTSDRSIASIDIALRRRFKFKEMMPKSDLVADFGCNFKDCFELLNKRISVLLDRDHQIGHSYFINDKHQNDGINELKNIWFDSILPLLNEYFYGDWEKLQALLGQATNDNTSFVKKIEKISFANSYSCDESENYDFTPETECNFVFAMQNAFGNKFEV